MSVQGAPLSPGQQGLWAFDQVCAARAAYNIVFTSTITGPLDIRALAEAFGILLDRHAALRSAFSADHGVPRQHIRPAPDASVLVCEDLSATAAGRQTARVEAVCDDELSFTFELGGPQPLIRARLLILGRGQHLLVVNVHHIVFDGWSQQLLLRELGELYGTLVTGDTPALAAPSQSYQGYVRWHLAWLASAEAEQQSAFWAGQLAGATDVLALPTDRPRPPVQDHTGAALPLHLPTALTDELRAIADQQRTSLYTLLLTAWSLVLSRLSHQDVIVVGVPTANRRRNRDAGVVGYFVNTVPVRVDLAGAGTVSELVAATYGTLRAALRNSDLPFAHIAERSGAPRSRSHSPVFQTMVAMQPTQGSALQLAGTVTRTVKLPVPFALFDLTLAVSEEHDGLSGCIEFAATLFDRDTVARIARYLIRVLEQFARSPHQQLSEITLLDGDEMDGLLQAGTGWDAATSTALLDRFAEQVRRQRDQRAVVTDTDTLTYGQLDRLSNATAHLLSGRGIGRGQVVGIYGDRSAALVVAILGVLKAGAAYLPLDCGQPAQRLRAMVDEARPAAILHCAPGCPGEWNALALPESGSDLAAHCAADPGDIAYVMYTSGSTGRPKGVAIPHRGVMHLVDHWVQRFGPIPGAAASVWAGIGFDASVQELFPGLLSGAVLHIVPAGLRSDPAALVRWMGERAVVQAFLPPSHLSWIAEHPAARLSGLSLRYLATGVEPFTEQSLYEIERALPGLHILYGYGPTEATVYASAYADYRPLERRCPIGTPLPGARMYILDRQMRPAPIGVVGEIYLAGAGLAAGYLNRPDLTEQRFVPDPFVPGEKMYRTGDLARRHGDGSTEWVARADDQVKIRGFRVEPGELEAALRTVAGVREAVVLVDDAGPGEQRLVAAVARSGPALAPATWRTELSRLLPDYLMPTAVVERDRLPLNPNGKLDRAAVLAAATCDDRVNTVAPRDQVEMALLRIWRQILGRDAIGISDNFFDIGGSSVSAVKLVSAIQGELGANLAVRELIVHPTIEQLAVLVRAGTGHTDEDPVVEFRAGAGSQTVVCIHPAGGTAFCYLPLSTLLPAATAVVGIQSPGINPGVVLPATIEAIARDYTARLQPTRDVVVCGLSYGGLLAHEVARRLAATGRTRVSAVLLDARIPADDATRAAIVPAEFAEFREKLVRFNGAYPDIGDDQVRRYFEVYNHHRATVRRYRPRRSDARIVYVRGNDADQTDADVTRTWQPLTAHQFRLEHVAAGHWQMLEGQALQRVCEIVTDELADLANTAAHQKVS